MGQHGHHLAAEIFRGPIVCPEYFTFWLDHAKDFLSFQDSMPRS
jgi:hypothetical protein